MKQLLFNPALFVITMLGFFLLGASFAFENTPLESYASVAAIAPHHMVAESMIDEVYNQISQSSPQTLVVIAPNHYGTNNLPFLSTSQSDFLGISIDQELTEKLHKNLTTINFSHEKILLDHGVTIHAQFIKDFLPETKVVPLLVSRKTTITELDELLSYLNGDGSFVLASADFSHYLNTDWATIHDRTAITALTQKNYTQLPNLEVDCWQCLYTAITFAEKHNSGNFQLIDNNSSADFIQSPHSADEVTSYVTGVFTPKKSDYLPEETFLFTGDVMLSRSVAQKISEQTGDSFFTGAQRLTRGFNYVIGNLEGVVTSTTQSSEALEFPVDPSYLGLLNHLQFTHLGLANNHALDLGEATFATSKELIADAGITPFGDPSNLVESSFTDIDTTWGILRLFNLYIPNNQPDSYSQSLEFLQDSIQKEGVNLLYIHWGIEYMLEPTPKQVEFAQSAIDAGIDGILGHHPHVIQTIDVYNGVPIFYSLGNFIFDQNFSDQVETSLAVALALNPDTQTLEWSIFPLELNQFEPSHSKDSYIINIRLTQSAQTQFESKRYSYTYSQQL